jgi:hypothetical protein
MNIIEPCCAERQLGHLLRENAGHAILLQTNGDVTLAKWMQATMLLSGDRPRTLTIAMPACTEKTMATVAKYLQLGWVGTLRLLTTQQIPAELLQHLADKTGCPLPDLLRRLELAEDAAGPEGLLMFSGSNGTVAVQGAMTDAPVPGLHLYAAVMGRTIGAAVRSVTDAWEARFRAHRYEPETSGPETSQKKSKRQVKNTQTAKQE